MRRAFCHPSLNGLQMGTREWFAAQRGMIRSKPLIQRCYDLWYRRLCQDADSVPAAYRTGLLVELGSGSNYIKELRAEVITSDVTLGAADMVADGRALPFPSRRVQALLLTHVFHHIPESERFLAEAARVLVPGGVISMIEVTHTPFARWFFSWIHPEPYNDRVPNWSFPEGHSILDSNQALSWIVFMRDARRFQQMFPDLRIERRVYLPWLSYLLSGGVNLRSFVPRSLTPLVVGLDWLVKPFDGLFAIHWHITIRKASPGGYE